MWVGSGKGRWLVRWGWSGTELEGADSSGESQEGSSEGQTALVKAKKRARGGGQLWRELKEGLRGVGRSGGSR